MAYVQKISIPVTLDNGDAVTFDLYADAEKSLQQINCSLAEEFCESPYQLMEGCFYEYQLPNTYRLEEIKDLSRRSRCNPSSGRITPGTNTGGITLKILDP